MQMSIVLKPLPNTLWQLVQVVASSLASYDTLRTVSIGYALPMRARSDSLGKPPVTSPGQPSDPNAIEVDYIDHRGKSRGKGKAPRGKDTKTGKGKHNGGTSNVGEHWSCGRESHRATERWRHGGVAPHLSPRRIKAKALGRA